MATNPVNQIIEEIKNLDSMAKLDPEKYAEFGGYAERFVKECNKDNINKLNANQLRKIFHYVKGLKREFHQTDFERHKVSMIMPLLAYAKGRNLIPEYFYELMKVCFGKERCKTKEDFNESVNFLEAIVAYHKYYS